MENEQALHSYLNYIFPIVAIGRSIEFYYQISVSSITSNGIVHTLYSPILILAGRNRARTSDLQSRAYVYPRLHLRG
jgi:hypothetical protein